MMTENEDRKNKLTQIAAARSDRSFAERMGEAGYTAGRRYDAVKNAFLAYKSSERKPKFITSRISRSGETFRAGRRVLGKLCLVGGYLRLFLALDPALYNAEKYHHKDYSEVVRYAKFPFMIKLSSDRQVRYAEELIGEVCRQNGFVRDEGYIVRDQANIFKKPKHKKALQSTEQFPEIITAMSETAMSETAMTETAVSETAAEAPAEPEAIDVSLPTKATVVDKQGAKIGKVRSGVWLDADEQEQGVFKKEETNVFVYAGEMRTGYVDKNDNILTLDDQYVATIRRGNHVWVLFLVLLLVLITLLTFILTAYFLTRSGNVDYAPVLFIATEDGENWEDTENLPVFMNERFGDSKIAPGMRGSYRFTFENRNANTLLYGLSFTQTNEYGIEIVYRLKRDGAYIAGAVGYVALDGLGIGDLTIEPHSATIFELEWYWRDNDEADTQAGENSAVYTLAISLTEQVSERA